MNRLISIFKKWIPLAIVTAGVCGLVYLATQQTYRANANDPQIQMAEDAASALSNGTAPETLVPTAKIDIATSLSPFLMIFDETGKVVASSATLHGQNPSIPAGILDYVKQNGEDRFTWQPENGIRIAAVVTKSDHNFVLAGRSLRETEKRIDQTGTLSVAAALVILVVVFLAIALGEFVGSER